MSIYQRADDLTSLPYSAGYMNLARSRDADTLAGMLDADDATLASALEGMTDTDLAGLAADMARAEAIAEAEIETGRTLGGYDTTDPESLGNWRSAPANSKARWGRVKRKCQCIRQAATQQRQQRKQAAGMSPSSASATGAGGIPTAQPGQPDTLTAALPLFLPLTQPLAGWAADAMPEGMGSAAPVLPGSRIDWAAWRSPWDGATIQTVAARQPQSNEEAMALQAYNVWRKAQARRAAAPRFATAGERERAAIVAANNRRALFRHSGGWMTASEADRAAGLGFFKKIGRALKKVVKTVGNTVRKVAPAIVGAIPVVGGIAASLIPPPKPKAAPAPAPRPAPRPAVASLTTGTAASTSASPATFNTSTLALLAAGGALLFLAARR